MEAQMRLKQSLKCETEKMRRETSRERKIVNPSFIKGFSSITFEQNNLETSNFA